jgi:hypothetical protein
LEIALTTQNVFLQHQHTPENGLQADVVSGSRIFYSGE